MSHLERKELDSGQLSSIPSGQNPEGGVQGRRNNFIEPWSIALAAAGLFAVAGLYAGRKSNSLGSREKRASSDHTQDKSKKPQ